MPAPSPARAAAIVHGYRTFDPEVDVAGVIFNRVGSDHHEELLREATADVGATSVLGALRRDDRVIAPERHLGLVPAAERAVRGSRGLRPQRDRRNGTGHGPQRGPFKWGEAQRSSQGAANGRRLGRPQWQRILCRPREIAARLPDPGSPSSHRRIRNRALGRVPSRHRHKLD